MEGELSGCQKITLPMYYLSDEGRVRKCANTFGISRSTVSQIVRRVTTAITQHLGKSYIKLPLTQEEVFEKQQSLKQYLIY